MFLGWYVQMHSGADTLSKLFYLGADITAFYATTLNNYLRLSHSSQIFSDFDETETLQKEAMLPQGQKEGATADLLDGIIIKKAPISQNYNELSFITLL